MADKFTPFAIVRAGMFPFANAMYQLAPTNAKMLARSFIPTPLQTPITEKDFPESELNILRETYLNSLNRLSPEQEKAYTERLKFLNTLGDEEQIQAPDGSFIPAGMEKEFLKRRLSKTIQYGDYPFPENAKYNIGDAPMSASFTNPAYSLSTTIGRAQYNKDKQKNVHIKDVYDFPKGTGMDDYKDWSTFFKVFHALGEKYSNPMQIDINLGQVKEKK